MKAPDSNRASRHSSPSARLLDAAVAIQTDPDTVDRAYMARQLVQCTLPHSNPGSVEIWRRRNGRYVLTIQRGWDTMKGVPIGHPYGTLPRLILFWLTTEIVQKKQRRIELGDTLSAFMWELGLDSNSRGKRSDAKRLREQMVRLFRCKISFDDAEERGNHWCDMQIAPVAHLWWDPRMPEQADLWGSWIEIGESFYEATLRAPVPLDMRALRALRRSPMALDMYAWANHRVFGLKEAAFIPWRALAQQMGADYDDIKDFKKKARAALLAVRTVSRIKISFPKIGGGIYLHPSPVAVRSRGPATIETEKPRAV